MSENPELIILRNSPVAKFGYRNRLAVAMNWLGNYVTSQRGARLITGITGSRIEDVMSVVTTASSRPIRGNAGIL